MAMLENGLLRLLETVFVNMVFWSVLVYFAPMSAAALGEKRIADFENLQGIVAVRRAHPLKTVGSRSMDGLTSGRMGVLKWGWEEEQVLACPHNPLSRRHIGLCRGTMRRQAKGVWKRRL